jgi:hypothetical protein
MTAELLPLAARLAAGTRLDRERGGIAGLHRAKAEGQHAPAVRAVHDPDQPDDSSRCTLRGFPVVAHELRGVLIVSSAYLANSLVINVSQRL